MARYSKALPTGSYYRYTFQKNIIGILVDAGLNTVNTKIHTLVRKPKKEAIDYSELVILRNRKKDYDYKETRLKSFFARLSSAAMNDEAYLDLIPDFLIMFFPESIRQHILLSANEHGTQPMFNKENLLKYERHKEVDLAFIKAELTKYNLRKHLDEAHSI